MGNIICYQPQPANCLPLPILILPDELICEILLRLPFLPNYPSLVDPLFVSKNGVVLLLDEWSNQLVLYNMYSGQLDNLSISSMLGLHLHIYHESLISPQ
ncbi:hypothetical protein P8452_34410 [Trifolium repens]|nr:hypothetical protein P8452_34410 [Trifolium repens]